MAGESPDRSKQRESSEGATPGSTGPVPEARNEGGSAGKRDPRLGVPRDASPDSSTSSESAGERGGVDTATRVLSVRDAQTDDEEAGDSTGAADSVEAGDSTGAADSVEAGDSTGAADSVEAGDSTGAADSVEAGDGTSGRRADSAADGEGDPLDAVVAAWVRSADEVEREESREDTTGVQETEDADDGDTGAKSGPKDGRDGSASRDEGSSGASRGGSADGAGAADVPERSDEPDGSGAEDEPEPAAGSGAEDEPEPAAGSGAGAEAEPEADAGTGPVADTAPDATEDAPRATADASPEDDATPTPTAADGSGSNTDAVSEPKSGPRADAKSEATPEPGTDQADGTGTDDDDRDGDAEHPTDQPTAVFKAPRPSASAVDQPTTMLKLGDAAKDTGTADGAAAEGKAEPGSDPTSDPRRTGTFVPLKDLDDPETRKPSKRPKDGDSATTALRLPPSAQARSSAPSAPPAEGTRSVPQVGPELTRQQPLPPKPPLDLLAELTNTPPPPDTPLRTTVRRVKIWTPLVALLVIVFAVVQNMRALPTPTLELTAEDSYTFDGGKVDIPWPADGQAALDVQGIGTFGSSGEQKPVPIASVAKVMTTYLILREHPLKSGAEGPAIEIDDLAEEQSDAGQESTVNVTAGDEISQREALEAVLIASANNVARLLARWDAESEEAFVEKMNKTAEDLGMTNTTYTDPSGLNNTTVSTAVDQVKLARAAMKQPAFREIAAMMSYDDYKGVNHPNWNQLVGSNGVVGIKTGTTTSALGNLVFAAKKDVDGEIRTIVGAVVRQPAGGADNTILAGALSAGDQLIRAAQDVLESTTVLKKDSVVGYVDDGLGGRTPVVLTEDLKAAGWPGLKVKLTFAGAEVPHQAKAGTEVGSLTVGDGTDSGAVKVPVALQEDLVEPGFTDKLTRVA
ncbi:D-alanyl-D-alanine carboxypeptidase [Streptomyces sp. AVP053U2]|uniref:D-alanyl-D-alanine carboxypeptidase n=1 Tax=Streptomyces sp. AVP053U2 TaxID=1737066 RepID=UPI00083D6074|nr:D-alanyl-D-alanine carboxypeptidase [Streptomyces sp. AVP053U2]ODA75720.1 D-alanyl-D-alanine carboxypeptidase DacF precursor [Streptomyces sp. AVP053U2]